MSRMSFLECVGRQTTDNDYGRIIGATRRLGQSGRRSLLWSRLQRSESVSSLPAAVKKLSAADGVNFAH
jgi:hypothetical protein